MTNRCIYFEEIAMGDLLESGGRTITEADVVFHAGHTGDFFPHHMDAEFEEHAIAKPHRPRHDDLAIGVRPKANAQLNEASFIRLRSTRFIKPAAIGDTIRTRTRIIRKEMTPNARSSGVSSSSSKY
jgi:acyl dehydratase